MRIPNFSPEVARPHSQSLKVQHYARLRYFARYTWHGEGSGWSLQGPIDEELASLGLLKPSGKGRGWLISQSGRDVFEARAAYEEMRRRPHHALANRASRWLNRQGRLAWLNRPFPIYLKPDRRVMQNLGLTPEELQPILSRTIRSQVTSRPDVISIVSSASRSEWNSWILEAKVNRRDFLLDIKNPAKRYAYALLAQQVFYLAPAGLVTEDEVPKGCGLIFETRPGAFSIVKTPPECKPLRSAHISRLLRES